MGSATTAASGRELWKSDGTSAGTLPVKDINSGAANSGPANLTGAANALLISSAQFMFNQRAVNADSATFFSA